MRDFTLSPEQAEPFLKHLRDKYCRWCSSKLPENIQGYTPHEGGWRVKGEPEKVWLYITCPKCGYDWSIWKLGVPRDAE